MTSARLECNPLFPLLKSGAKNFVKKWSKKLREKVEQNQKQK
jgi:hypothetical protein